MTQVSAKLIERRKVSAGLLDSLPDDLHPVLRRVYAAREVDPGALDTSLAAMIPVSRLDGCKAAADRLALAREAGQRVLVLGDFDADGATATSLVITCLRAFGFKDPVYLVPDRFRFGYGLSPALVVEAAELAPDIILTVDNGISSNAGVAAANERGIDVIVTDHHLPGETLPEACVIVNPNVPDNTFPSKNLAGVGVAFYVMAALGQRLAAEDCLDAGTARSIVADCLDLVALGTVADLVPLDQNNRILISQGLGRIRAGRARPGLQALFAAADRSCSDAAAGDLGFAIAPRLNAAGRLTDMMLGIDCLLSDSFPDARKRAAHLSDLNVERRELQAAMQAEAEQILCGLENQQAGPGDSAVCLYDAGWHQGIVGLVATRIREQLGRPVIAFAPGENDKMLKGSGRSVQGVHLRDVLAGIDARYPELLGRYGGHAMAAGLSLDADKLKPFRQAFIEEVDLYADRIEESDRLLSDGALEAADLNLGLAETLRFSGPWGQGFPEPVFDGRFQLISQRVVGKRHLKLKLKPANSSATVSGIAFNQPELDIRSGDPELNVAYRLDVNEFRGVREHQLLVVHIECV